MAEVRRKPNILVTGNPGTGKSTICSLLADATQLRHIDVGDLVEEKGVKTSWRRRESLLADATYDYVYNEDQICKELEPMIEQGGNIVDYHECFYFPDHWFDCVIVLETDLSIIDDRLTSRGYTGRNLYAHIRLEALNFLTKEAIGRYSTESVVMVLQSDCIEDISKNFTTLSNWISNWKPSTSS